MIKVVVGGTVLKKIIVSGRDKTPKSKNGGLQPGTA